MDVQVYLSFWLTHVQPGDRAVNGVISQTRRWDGTVARGGHCGATLLGSKVGSVVGLEV